MDFQKIIQELIDHNMTQLEIKERCHCGQSTISDILNGRIKNPNFTLGQSILKLHAEKLKKIA